MIRHPEYIIMENIMGDGLDAIWIPFTRLATSEKNQISSQLQVYLDNLRNSRAKLLHIVTDNEEVLNRWTGFLEATLTYRQGSMTTLMAFDDGAMAQYWQTEMISEFGNQPRDPEQEELDMAGVKR
ncbi:hypothetical protein FOXB_07478, partial [Fusarium oxysporum f. sp. conglutinans Fo5176]